MTSLADKLKEKLQASLSPVRLVVNDDSAAHAGHAGNPDGAGQTHFSIEIVSDAFHGKSRVDRHRMVMAEIQSLWGETSLHALALKTLTPDE